MLKIKVGIYQCAFQESFDFKKTLIRLENYSYEASLKGVELILFPEGFIGDYPRYSHFGAHFASASNQ